MRDKKIYAHLVTWFKTKQYSGTWTMWNSNFPQSPHNPDNILYNGKRDIAATSYPLTEPYDSSDKDLLEYQFLLMKLSGIDGVIIDWDGRRINPYRHEILMEILPLIEKYGLEIMICFEEWAGYWPIGEFKYRDDEISAAKQEMKWLLDKIFSKPYYAQIDNKKPVLIFRKIGEKLFTKDEFLPITELVEHNGGVVIFPQFNIDYVPDAAHGSYFWIGNFDETGYCSIESGLKNYENFCKECKTMHPRGDKTYIVGCVCPGFNDTPVWGWGEKPRTAPHGNGKRYNQMWEISIKYNLDIVQILTWNDWNEGSQIEPSDTYGFDYLISTKKYSAIFKQKEDNIPDSLLEKTLQLYNMRKDGCISNEEANKTLNDILKHLNNQNEM